MSVLMTILSVAGYILMAVGLARIAARRGIPNCWFAWIPILNLSLLGSVSDYYQYDARGAHKQKKKVLPILTLVPTVLILLVIAVAGGSGDLELAGAMMIFSAFVGFVLGIAAVVIYFMALRDLYLSCSPAQATLYTVLSVLFPVTISIFVFCLREKGSGASEDAVRNGSSSGSAKIDAYAASVKNKVREARTNGVRCPDCGAFVQGKEASCPYCGCSLPVDAPRVETPKPAETPVVKSAAEKRCPVCGEVLAADDLFCTGCGSPISHSDIADEPYAGRKCPSCGEPLEADDLFCPGCGRSLQNAPAEAEKHAAEAYDKAEIMPEKPAAAITAARASPMGAKTAAPESEAADKKLIIRRSSEKAKKDIFTTPEL